MPSLGSSSSQQRSGKMMSIFICWVITLTTQVPYFQKSVLWTVIPRKKIVSPNFFKQVYYIFIFKIQNSIEKISLLRKNIWERLILREFRNETWLLVVDTVWRACSFWVLSFPSTFESHVKIGGNLRAILFNLTISSRENSLDHSGHLTKAGPESLP